MVCHRGWTDTTSCSMVVIPRANINPGWPAPDSRVAAYAYVSLIAATRPLLKVMSDESLPEFHCYRCVYTWTPRHTPIRRCPRCKSHLWNVPEVRPTHLGNGLGIPEVLGPHRERIIALVESYGAKRVRVFGSVRRREADEKSDVDLLVDRLPRASLLDRAHLETELRKVVGRPVDVVEEDCLPWSLRPQALAEATPL